MSFSERVTSTHELGSVIRAARVELGISQRELAQRSGRSQRFISELERGKETAEIGRALSVLDALGLVVVVQSTNPAGAGREAVRRTVDSLESRLGEGRARRKGLSDYLEELS